MRRILLCTGVLGGGTVLTFAAAALAWTLFPNGTLVAGTTNPMMFKGGVAMPAPAPGMVMPAGPVIVDDSAIDGTNGLTPDQVKALQEKLQNAGAGTAPNVVVTVDPSPDPATP